MGEVSFEDNKVAFQQEIRTENMEPVNREADAFAFSDQTMTDKILISGTEEGFGSLDQELTKLSAMSETRLSERQQSFVNDTMFAQDVNLQMRDSSYLGATAELHMRKQTKSHRYDKTRKNRMETSRKTLGKVNEDIKKLKGKLQEAEESGAPVKLMNKIESMESIYANIRVADRNCAEAMSLNKAEEQRLKDKADLTYRKNLKRMYEHEMESLDSESADYAAVKKRWEINERAYNKLMKPVLEQQAKNAQKEVKQEVQEKDIQVGQTLEQAPVLLDARAEARVTENVNSFKKLLGTLNDKKYGKTQDPLWDDMKAKAELLVKGWEKMTDHERGDAMAEVMISANRLLCKEGKRREEDENRAGIAGEFRSFFKSTLNMMSVNCRVLALERIFKKVDTMDDDTEVPEKLKKSNESVFVELSKEKYREKFPDISEDDRMWGNFDDMYYRTLYANDKYHMHLDNFDRMFADTEDFKKAEKKFSFKRNKTNNIVAEDFRLDRFGNVLEEDKDKVENWKKKLKDIADADTEGALKIHKEMVLRTLNNPVDPAWMTDKGLKRNVYEFKSFTRKIGCLENNITDWKTEYQGKMREQRAELEKLPAFKIRDEIVNDLEWVYSNKIWDLQGIVFGSELHLLGKDSFKTMASYMDFYRDPKKKVLYQDDTDVPFIHRDGTEFSPEEDVDEKGYLKQNKDNPLILTGEYYREKLIPKVEEMHRMDQVESKVMKVAASEEGAIEKLKKLVKEKGDPKEIERVEKLSEEYIKEVRNQAYERDALEKTDPDAEIDEKKKDGGKQVNFKNAYYHGAVQYFKKQQRVDELFDELEKTREELIKKTAGEEAFKKWKKELDDEREERRKAEKKDGKKGSDPLERVKKAYIMRVARDEVSFFSEEEIRQIEKNKETKGPIKREQINRVLCVFILPVNRDPSGAYLTEQDRKNADFNKRFKHAMMYGDGEEIKNISREFTSDFLPTIKTLKPEDADNMDIEKAEEKYIDSNVFEYSRIRLSMLSCVNGTTNTNFPLLRTGLDELKEKDPERYKELEAKLASQQDTMMSYFMLSKGFDTEKLSTERNNKAMKEYESFFEAMKESFRNEM